MDVEANTNSIVLYSLAPQCFLEKTCVLDNYSVAKNFIKNVFRLNSKRTKPQSKYLRRLTPQTHKAASIVKGKQIVIAE